MKRVAVIMAGGSGERFWPMSRKKKPKQLLPLASDNAMIEESLDRIAPLIPPKDIFIITGEHLLAPLRKALPQLPPENIVAEPMKRNTAPCLALAAAFISARYVTEGYKPDQVSVAVLTADQSIQPREGFLKTVEEVFVHVENNPKIATIGIPPSRPETGYGYIETEKGFADAGDSVDIQDVLSFREKPDIDKAREFMEEGRFLWNSGMFFWRVDTFVHSMIKFCPEIGGGIADMARAYLDQTHEAPDIALETITEIFEKFPNTSIDYGLMEKTDNVTVARALFDWDDIGSWDSLERVRPVDSNGNVCTGANALVDVRNSVVFNSSSQKDIIVAGIGLKDMVVVVTDDAVLVCPKDRVQEVKKNVEIIRDSDGEQWL